MLTGSAFRATIQASADRFHLLAGKPNEYIKTADSGTRRVHAFCGSCGSPVYACAPEHPQSYSLRLGALEERDALGPPVREIWSRRRLPWMPRLDGVPEIEGQP